MDYSSMDHADAARLIRGKRVAVVGSGKSAFDTVMQCAEVNGPMQPCTMVYRSTQWMVDAKLKWSDLLGTLLTSRLAELMVHKPGEGFVLALLATMLAPLRWLLSKLIETYYKTCIPMARHGVVPDYSFDRSILGCRLGILPEGFYERVDAGSIVMRQCQSLTFCADGLLLNGTDGERAVKADVVILATGYQADRQLREVFVSPWFSKIVTGKSDTTVPLYRYPSILIRYNRYYCTYLTAYAISDVYYAHEEYTVFSSYRQCVHPRIPQMAIIGYSESAANIYPYELMAKWVAHLLHGELKLPNIEAMEQSVAHWARWGQLMKRSSGAHFRKSCIGRITTPGGRVASSPSGCSPTDPLTIPISSDK
ncbi:hypothetical protein PR202_gb16103 [Eleusine coracana subsp. coracana]|uniref:Flavin-containing monooxygenase n=1 Tax=Eleusine coracana subsp. coracana TaxID=191504 RepID=A0AAV5EYY8_ELECO|nr:hypothetical protein PR202_gb16103 [Eleusine coracana subsp. coracana]